MTSTWAHFKELSLLFKMSPSSGHLLNSFRRYELTNKGVVDKELSLICIIFCYSWGALIFLKIPLSY